MKRPLLLILLAPALLCAGCGKGRDAIAKVIKSTASGSSNAVTELAAADVPAFTQSTGCVAVLDFHAPWCGPCRQLGPVLEKIAKDSGGAIRLGKVNVDKARELAGKMGVRGVPDVRIYRDGREIDRFVGSMDEATARRRLEAHTGGLAAAAGQPPAPAAPEPGSKDWLPPGMTRR